MSKKSITKTKKVQVDESGSPIPKALGLFDHVNHIRKIQSIDYYDNLSDADKKSFNHFMILKILSMDKSSIDSISSISKYQSIIPSRNFYLLCTAVTNQTNTYFPYIKSTTKFFSDKLIEFISKKFEVSTSEAKEYCKIYMKDEAGVNELRLICKGYGLTDKEVNQTLKHE